jgi:hypothetical protein
MTINCKGVGPFLTDSFHRFMCSTNTDFAVKSKEDDRRNLIVLCSKELIGNKQYFIDLHKLLDDVNIVKSCYEYFKSLPDLNKFGSLCIPKTNYQENLKELVKEKTRRTSQIKNHVIESIISISQEDFKKYGRENILNATEKYINFLQNEYGLKIYTYALHTDEGHIEDGQELHNYHIHIIHSSISLETGKSFKRELYNAEKLDANGEIVKNKKGEILKRLDLSKAQDDIFKIYSSELENLQRHKKNKEKHLEKEDVIIKKQFEKLKKENEKLKIDNDNLEIEKLKLFEFGQKLAARIKELEKVIENLEYKLKIANSRMQQVQITRKIDNVKKQKDNLSFNM